ncbi:MAG: alpha/beta fold hydrolase [Chloroflexi bacterium]|nr:alpha/beta fold hydrolase [Chloroflexota bacterium]
MKNKILFALLIAISTVVACSGTTSPAAVIPPTPPATPTMVIPEPTATPKPAATSTSTTVTAQSVYKFEEGGCPFKTTNPNVQCGYVVVPEDHNNPSGPIIRLAVAVLKNTSSARRPDPVILLAGGPGEKAVASTPGFAALLAPMVGERDFIVFDQRGVGLSKPALECPEWLQRIYELLNEPNPDIKAQAIFESLMVCRERLAREGINLSAYNTVQNAADVNAIRIALGYDKLNLFGGSYGTLLAQAVMRDHPQGIRSVVLASVLPLEKSFFVDVSTTAAKSVTKLTDACAGNNACNTEYPDLKNVLFKTIERLNANPATITVTNPVDGKSYKTALTGEAVFGNLTGLLYQTNLIPILPRAIYDVSKGDYALIAQLMGVNIANYGATSRGMTYSVFCADDLIGRTLQDYDDNRKALPPQLVGQASTQAIAKYGPFATCESWKVKSADPSVKKPVVSDIPTLILEGAFDPVTPPEYGELVAKNLRNSYVYTFPNAGHNVITTVECGRQVARAFYDNPNSAPQVACTAKMSGVVFDVPGEAPKLTLKPYSDPKRGFSGVVPEGWKGSDPSNAMRGSSALDVAYFVLEAQRTTAAGMFNDLMSQLRVDPLPKPINRAKVGNFTWDFYTFQRQGKYPADLVIAEDGKQAYFVYMVSSKEEHDALYEQLFIPAVKAMMSLE